MKIQSYNLVLGSQSPRRKELLEEAGFKFRVEVRSIDEIFDPKMDVYKVAEYLAVQKTLPFDGSLKDDEILLTADSVVILDRAIFGKPNGVEGAKVMLGALSGKMHTVVTGVALKNKDKLISFSDHAQVYMDSLSDEEIDYYIHECQPFDKAGSYGIQEWIGYCKINKIEGTFANIKGLPVNKVYQQLQICFQ